MRKTLTILASVACLLTCAGAAQTDVVFRPEGISNPVAASYNRASDRRNCGMNFIMTLQPEGASEDEAYILGGVIAAMSGPEEGQRSLMFGLGVSETPQGLRPPFNLKPPVQLEVLFEGRTAHDEFVMSNTRWPSFLAHVWSGEVSEAVISRLTREGTLEFAFSHGRRGPLYRAKANFEFGEGGEPDPSILRNWRACVANQRPTA